MTALAEYAQLESTGLWRASADAQRREVGLSFGDTTLVISDSAARPLAHWSLPAVTRLNPGVTPAVFSPGPDDGETVEITDDLMIEALDKVRRAVERARPRPGRLRRYGRLAVLLVSVGALALWLPGALRDQALEAVPLSKRAEIGATLLGHIQRITGPTCRNPLGTSALASLRTRVLGREAPGQVVVVPAALPGAIYLPGGIIVLSQAMIEGTDDPAVVAGHILAAALSRTGADPLEPILREAGLMATLTLLTTGDLPGETLADEARDLLATPTPLAGAAVLAQGFAAASVPLAPWAAASGRPVDDMAPYVAAAQTGAAPEAPLLTDGNWISLQGICAG